MTTPNLLRTLSLCSILMVLPMSLAAQPQTQTGGSEKLVQSYVAAFNGGEETMRRFMTENFAKVALEERSVDARLSVYRQLRTDMGDVSLKTIQNISNGLIEAVLSTKKNEFFLFTFYLEDKPPHQITGIRIEDTSPPDSSGSSTLSEKEALDEVARYLDVQSKSDAFSGTVLIARGGQQIWTRACGMASKEFDAPNRTDTKFNLGSINKIFTQIAIGQLLEGGKLSLDDPIIRFLPSYPNGTAARKVTLRHLLAMSSGIGDIFGEKYNATPKDKLRANGDFLQLFAGDSLLFEPGTQQKYSNGGYVVLGAVIESASGQTYYEYVREHIFKIAGMLNTGSYQADEVVPNLAEGYTREDSAQGEWRKNIYSRPARGSAAGGGYSTAGDLLAFTVALDKNVFFTKPGTWNLIRGGPSGSAAQRPIGMTIFGGAPGINSGVGTGIGRGYTAIVMSNYDPPSAGDVLRKIRSTLQKVK